jgi:hypothetical protein
MIYIFTRGRVQAQPQNTVSAPLPQTVKTPVPIATLPVMPEPATLPPAIDQTSYWDTYTQAVQSVYG